MLYENDSFGFIDVLQALDAAVVMGCPTVRDGSNFVGLHKLISSTEPGYFV